MRKMVWLLLLFVFLLPCAFATWNETTINQIITAPDCPTIGDFGCTQHNPYTLFYNNTLVGNTTIHVYSDSGGTTSTGSVVFAYSNGSTYTVYVNGTGTGVTVNVSNPGSGTPVNNVTYTTGRTPASNIAYLQISKIYIDTPVAQYSFSLSNVVNNNSISSFCASFNTGATTNCTVTSNGSTFLNATDSGWNSENRGQNFERLLASWQSSGNISPKRTFNGGNYTLPPWYTRSDQCTTSYLNTGCGLVSAQKDNNNYYCLITDEISVYCLGISMTTNTSLERDAVGCYNTIQAINATTGGYGHLTEWATVYDNRSGTPMINKSFTNDAASDADARFIIANYNYANNNNFSDSTFKSNARTLARQMCTDMVQYDFVHTNKISASNASRNMTYFPAGGPVVAGSGLTGADFMYSGYYGDHMLALLGCYTDTTNSTFLTIAQDEFENLLAAANWTPSTGFRVPPGRAFKWSSSTTPVATCTTVCTPAPYIDDPDGKRMASVCAAEKSYRQAGLTLHPNALQYCSDWATAFNNNLTAYASEWYYNGTRKNAVANDMDKSSLATFLDMSWNSSNIGPRLNLVGGHFSSGTQTFDSTACQGLYNPGLAVEAHGYSISTAFATSMGFVSSNNTCAGGGSTTTYNIGGLRLDVNQPQNNSNIASANELLSVTVYNNNVTGVAGNVTNGTLPHLFYNSTLASIDPGFSGATYSAGTSSINWSSGNMFSANYSMESTYPRGTFQLIVPVKYPGGNNNKLHPTTDCTTLSGNNRFNFESQNATHFHVKADRGGFSSTGNYLYNSTQVVNFTTNFTTNVSKACIGTDCTGWEAFTRDSGLEDCWGFEAGTPGGGNTQFLDFNVSEMITAYNTTSGGSSGNANMTIYILDGSNNALLTSSANQPNATTVTYNWTSITGTKYWRVNITSNQSAVSFPNLTFSIQDPTQSYTYCTTNGAIIHNVSGTYNVTLYNVTDGNSQPVFYNVSIPNINLNTSNNLTFFKSYFSTTYQALLTIQAYRYLLNTSITTFTANHALLTNTTTNGVLYIPVNNGTNNIRVAVPGNYSKNQTITITNPLTTVSVNYSNIFDSIFYLGAFFNGNPLSTFEVNMTGNVTNVSIEANINFSNTTNGTIAFMALQGYTYHFYVNTSNYTRENTSILSDSNTEYYNFTVLISNTLNVTILDEQTELPVNENFSISIISPSVARNYTIQNGTGVIIIGTPEDYDLRYVSVHYQQRDYYLSFPTGGILNVVLYDIRNDNSSSLLATVRDTSNNVIENSTITLLRYYVSCNCYKIVQMARTSYTGQGLFYIQPTTGYYKWSVDYLGRNYFLSTTPEQIITDTRTFVIDFGTNYYQSYVGLSNIASIVTFNQTTSILTATYSDPGLITSGGCLKVTYLDGVTYQTLNNTCVSGSSGSMIQYIPNWNQTRYQYVLSINTTTQFSNHDLLAGFLDFRSVFNFGNVGAFLYIGVLLTLVIIFSYSAAAVFLITAVGMIALGFLDILPIELQFITGFITIAVGFTLFLIRT